MTILAGSLEPYGFEEIEPMVVQDSADNRRRLRNMQGQWSWEHVRDEDGVPTGLIHVLDPEELNRRRMAVWDRRKDILTDPEDPWSDYVHPDLYPLDADVPYFIKERLQKWKRAAREGIPEEERQPFPARCLTIRHDETRCWSWASNPVKLPRCTAHGGWTEQSSLKNAQYARQRLVEAAPLAVDTIEHLSQYAEGEAVRLKASTEILDRVGVRAGMDLSVEATVEVSDPALEVRSRLEKLASRVVKQQELEAALRQRTVEENTIEVEVISDEPS